MRAPHEIRSSVAMLWANARLVPLLFDGLVGFAAHAFEQRIDLVLGELLAHGACYRLGLLNDEVGEENGLDAFGYILFLFFFFLVLGLGFLALAVLLLGARFLGLLTILALGLLLFFFFFFFSCGIVSSISWMISSASLPLPSSDPICEGFLLDRSSSTRLRTSGMTALILSAMV